ncbi:class II aldolase/adducin family protein [Helicobacter brantae]|uniref:Class II aldolase/adducin N-terminal domain-containing protein n=1 Tax=Helicobacter brantae TaxID=375927 RepID=A0A3D8J5H8_9HELI|nr:class II aldolase/adducin family protein [Helicobacter brantae]RDU72154.1 hypothetical protein CQA58_00685 [Helicobacter brantae]
MNIALIIAGGVGQRTGEKTPKQFILVEKKPIIIYTLEAFERHKEIDLICVACLHGWENKLKQYANQYNIKKLKIITLGGETGYASIKKGLSAIQEYGASIDDIILIHDAIRPMISHNIISENIRICKKNGNAITHIPIVEALLQKNNSKTSNLSLDRDLVVRTQTPQSGVFGELQRIYNLAEEKGISNSTTLSTLITSLDMTCYFSEGSEENLKITTSYDIEIFKSLIAYKKNVISTYKKICVEGNKFLKKNNLCVLTWGNFSCRIPNTNMFCIKPSGIDYELLTEDSIVVIDLEGNIIEGDFSPSVDTPTHLEIYKENPSITNIVHTHSTFATIFAQAATPVPILGTTHADFFHSEIPITRTFFDYEITEKYEQNSGIIINKILREYEQLPAILVAHHAPFIFGYKKNLFDACTNAVILEEICKNAFFTLNMKIESKIPHSLVKKAYDRKNGKNAYYGQKKEC